MESASPDLNPAVTDEISVLNSIYGADTVSVTAPTPATPLQTIGPITVHLKLPNIPLTLTLSLPPTYPADQPPAVLPTCAALGEHLSKGAGSHAAEVARDLVQDVWHHEVCLYDLVEELERVLTDDPLFQAGHGNFSTASAPEIKDVTLSKASPESNAPIFEPSWIVDDPVTVHKSVFQARACRVSDALEAHAAVTALRGTDGKLTRATHHVWAYRIPPPPDSTGRGMQTDFDDDGERAAGAKVLGVLDAMQAQGVLVMVSRWFGGVLLGPERFRIIARCARGVVGKGGWVGHEGGGR